MNRIPLTHAIPPPRPGGPSTPEGKAISSRNAVRHGLFAVPNVTMDNESDDEYRDLFIGTLERINPTNRYEVDAVTDYVSSRWRLERVWEMETATANKALAELRIANPGASIPEAQRTADAFSEAYADSLFFANSGLYETRLRRACERAERRLNDILALRRKQGSESAETATEAKRKNELPASEAAMQDAAPARSVPAKIDPKTPRNAQCPCGSKLKFKRCCLLHPKPAAAAAGSVPVPETALPVVEAPTGRDKAA